ncbi:hypothetical protein Tco_0886828, partial [Tanacetum coccineum]
GSEPFFVLGLCLLWSVETLDAILAFHWLLFILAIDGGLGLSDCARGEGYRGNGEVGMGRGELVVVLGRWYGLETGGKGWYGFGG